MNYTEWKEDDPCRHCNFEPISHGYRGTCSSTEYKDSCYAWERFRAGIAAQRRLLKYLHEPCTEHQPPPLKVNYSHYIYEGYAHRYLCPECMKDIERELGI